MKKEEFRNKYHIGWNYESILCLYDLYLIQSLKLAEDLEDGIVLDDSESIIILHELKVIKECLDQIRKERQLESGFFEVSELISFADCKLVHGRLEGNTFHAAIHAAKKWVEHYQTYNREKDLFKYEVGIYILLLCEEEVFF